MKDQQSYISVFIAYLTIPSRNYEQQPRHDNSIPVRYMRAPESFSEKGTPDIDGFTNKPVVQCDVRVVKNTFVDDSK